MLNGANNNEANFPLPHGSKFFCYPKLPLKKVTKVTVPSGACGLESSEYSALDSTKRHSSCPFPTLNRPTVVLQGLAFREGDSWFRASETLSSLRHQDQYIFTNMPIRMPSVALKVFASLRSWARLLFCSSCRALASALLGPLRRVLLGLFLPLGGVLVTRWPLCKGSG